MKHRDARRHLVDLADGSLDEPLSARVLAHVEVCSVCDTWLATYRLVEGEFERRLAHPGVELIAAYSVEPADLALPDREKVESHLRQCASCTRESRLTRQALAESRQDNGILGPTHAAVARVRSLPAWTAAALAAALLVALLVVRPQPPEPQAVLDSVIYGHRVVETDQVLVAGNLQLRESSDVTFKAPEGVALGDGFSVRRGARLSISTKTEDPH